MSNIQIIDNRNILPQQQNIVKEIYKLRHDVFVDELKWVVASQDKLETDKYDEKPLLYVAHINDDGKTLDGCFRIKPTSGSYMLEDDFNILAPNATLPKSDDIWEVSRFAINKKLDLQTTRSVVSSLLIAMWRIGRSLNITDYVCVTEIKFERILRQAGLYTRRYGPPRDFGDCRAVAGIAPINDEVIARMEARAAKYQAKQASIVFSTQSAREVEYVY